MPDTGIPTDDALVSLTPAGSVSAIDHRIYVDEDIYRREQETIFRRSWIFVGLDVEIPNPGDFKTTYAGDVPVVVLRDEAGKIHVFENLCLHRGARLVRRECGNAKAMTCIYHHWSYGLDGRLQSVAMPKGFPASFRMADHRLPELPSVAVFAGLIFASYDGDAPPLAEALGGVADAVAEMTENGEIELLGYQGHRLKANWKLLIENTMDGYHPALLHLPILNNRMRASYRPNSGGAYKFANGNGLVKYPSTIVAEADWDPAQDLPSLLCKSRDGGWDYTISVFPNTLLLRLGDMLTVRQLIPRTPGTVDVIAYCLGLKSDSEALKDHRARVNGSQLGAGGVATVDDTIVMESIQSGTTATYGKTLLYRGDADAESGDSTDEIVLRGFYEKWAGCLGLLDKSPAGAPR